MSNEHNHSHSTNSFSKTKIFWVTLLNSVITVSEIAGGILSGSLALLSDSFHNLGDTLAIVLSFIANRIASRPKDSKRTFGYKRAEILAAFINSAVLAGVSLWLILEAWDRFHNPEQINGTLMLIVASIGLIANFVSVLLLERDSHENMNIKSSYLHLLSDTISSIGVIAGGIAIKFWSVVWIDPLITVLVSIYILKETWHILKQSVDIFMQVSPEIDYEALKKAIENIPGVVNIHHIHCWMLNDREVHFEAHVEMEDRLLSEIAASYKTIDHILKEDFGVTHITIQPEVHSCQNTNMF